MTRRKTKHEKEIQKHIDRWADLMMHIKEHPEVLDRIPDKANLLFGENDCIFIK